MPRPRSVFLTTVLEELRGGPRSTADLAAVTDTSVRRTSARMSNLVTRGLVAKSGRNWVLATSSTPTVNIKPTKPRALPKKAIVVPQMAGFDSPEPVTPEGVPITRGPAPRDRWAVTIAPGTGVISQDWMDRRAKEQQHAEKVKAETDRRVRRPRNVG